MPAPTCGLHLFGSKRQVYECVQAGLVRWQRKSSINACAHAHNIKRRKFGCENARLVRNFNREGRLELHWTTPCCSLWPFIYRF